MFITHKTRGGLFEVSDNNKSNGKLHINLVREGYREATHEEITKVYPELKPKPKPKTTKAKDTPKEETEK